MVAQKKEKRNRSWLQWTLPTMLFAVAIAVILTNYNVRQRETIREDEETKLEDLVFNYAREYEITTDLYKRALTYTADSCAMAEEPAAEENIHMLNALVNTYHFENGYILTGDEVGVDMEGEACPDVARRYYNRLDSSGVMLSGYFKTPDNRHIALIGAPIRNEDAVLGYVVVEYSASEMKDIVNTPDYISANVYAYIASNGLIIDQAGLDSRFMAEGNNFYDDSQSYVFTQGSIDEMRENLAENKTGTMRAKINTKNERLFIYRSVGEEGDFIILSANEQMLSRKVSDRAKPTAIVVNVIYLILSVFAVVVFAINIFNATTHARTNKELQDKAESDLLTGLLNKIATEEKIKSYLQGDGQERTSMMFVLDIDNFKNINDTMGHAFGDEVISELGRQLSAEFRVTDIVGRTGGDEFTIFLKDMKDDKIVHAEAERVLNIFKNFKVGEYTKYFATASIGVALYPQDADSFETLYKAADQALYKAKSRGKNQMAFYREK